MLTKKQNYEKIRTLNTGTDQAGMEITCEARFLMLLQSY